MTNTLRYPLRNISPNTILDLQEKYPNASVRIEWSDQPAQGGLSEQEFWALIDRLDWSKEGQDETVIEPVVATLAAGSLRHIYDFKDILSQKLYLLDTEEHAQNIGEGAYQKESDNFLPDGFLFARCCAVAPQCMPRLSSCREPSASRNAPRRGDGSRQDDKRRVCCDKKSL